MKIKSIWPDRNFLPAFATGRFIGEGFDEARLDTLFLALPVSWRGIIAQYAGRLHRLHDRKREVRVYDYADLEAPMLAKMFERRCRGYEAIGYTIQLPASAVPGWPVEVALPADPLWKQNYVGSVRRLIRDGVDRPLAILFLNATSRISSGATGVDRARSASEAFLFRRLESLPQTVGRFLLNVELPIPFDGRGRMEVDLLDADSSLAIELDGPQHLADPSAYRPVIVARTGCCRKTGISSSVSLPRTSVVTLTRYWTPSCGFWPIVKDSLPDGVVKTSQLL